MRCARECMFLVTIISFYVEDFQLASGYALKREKRQARKREEGEVDFDNIDPSLYGWEPMISPNCPPNQYVCRDQSYCFRKLNLCNDIVSCDDQSDEINALCGYTTTPTAPTTTATDQTMNSEVGTGSQTTPEYRNRFNDPLVIAFLVFVIAMLIYVVIATVCCIKYKMNAICPDAAQSTGNAGVKTVSGAKRPHANGTSDSNGRNCTNDGA